LRERARERRVGIHSREHALAAVLEPTRIVVRAGVEHHDAEVLAVPPVERVRVARAEEEAADAGHACHAARSYRGPGPTGPPHGPPSRYPHDLCGRSSVG